MSALLLLAASLALAAEPEPLSFEDLPRLVSQQNGEARGAGLQARAAERLEGHLGRSWLPTAELQAGAERFQTGDYGWRSEPYGSAEASLNLLRGGRDAAQGRARSARAAAARAAAKGALAEQLLGARLSFWELVSTRELAGLTEDALAVNERHLELAERRIRAGLATEADRLEFQIHRTVLQEELESLRHETLLIQLDLAARLGRPAGAAFATSTTVPHGHDEALFAESADSPAALALRAETDAAESERAAAARAWAPSLDLYGGYYLYTLRDRDYLGRSLRDDRAAGARLSLPLFDGLDSRAEAAAAGLRRDALEARARHAGLRHASELERAREEMRHVHELVHNGEERIAQGRRYLAVVLDEYGRGVKNSVDVLSAAQRQAGYLRAAAERRRDYEYARARLLALLGR